MLSIKMNPADFDEVIHTNLNSVFYCSKTAFKGSMMKLRRGKIINISSVIGQLGNAGQVNYSAAKGGVIAITKAMAKEFAPRNVCVNAVCPGYIQTDMTNGLESDVLLSKIPLGRFGTPENVAGLVRFLALDPASDYITGHCFNIDGGLAIGTS